MSLGLVLLGAPGFGGGGTVPVTTPADPRLGTLYRWHDTNTLSTLWQNSGRTTPVAANNDPIGAWDDQSGNGRHFVQATGGARPLYKATAFGTPAIQGDEIDDWLQHLVAIGNSYQIYIVAYTADSVFPGSGTKVDPSLTGGAGGSGIGLELYNGFGSTASNVFFAEFCNTRYVNGAAYSGAALTAGQTYALSAVNANTSTSNTGTYCLKFSDSTHLTNNPLKAVYMWTAAHNATQRDLFFDYLLTPGRFI